MRRTIVNYDYTKYVHDFAITDSRHPHVVRREIATTYVDSYALAEVQAIDERSYEQVLSGWSRSFYTREAHMKAVLQYDFPNISVNCVDVDTYRQAVSIVKNGFRSLPRVKAYDILTELDHVSYKASSAAGYDYIGAKGPPGDENHQRAIARAKAVLWSVISADGEGIDHAIQTSVPDVGYTRTQLADLTEKTKVRQVWGRAFHYILLEGIVADPLIQALRECRTFIHFGEDPTISVPRLLSDTARHCKFIYSIDWKSFDATVSRFEINTAFDIVKSLVTFPNYETEQAFEITRQLFLHKKVAAPDGYIYEVHKGIPSGSYYTSIIGSIINRLRIEYLWRILTGHGPKMCSTLGDDSLIGDDDLLVPSKIAKSANQIGWYINEEKTEYSTVPEGVTFLGRTFIGGMNTRELKKCLRLLVYPEYPVETGRISAYRAKSIHEDSGRLSSLLDRVASRLERHYGVASEEEVPFYFKRYVPFT